MTTELLTQKLLALLREKSLMSGDFELASGARSTYYVDVRVTTMSGRGQVLVGEDGWRAIRMKSWPAEVIGDLTLGADPVAYAIAARATLEGRTLDAFTVRKEAKQHGMGKLIEGAEVAGNDVIIVEDVLTTGGSAMQAIKAVEAERRRVIRVLAVLDREQGGKQRIEEAGYPGEAMFTATELLGHAPPASTPVS